MINDALSPIWSKIPVTARRLRNRIESVCQWVRDGRPLPASPEARKVKHHAALPHGQVPLLIEELRGLDKPEARALGFLILTAARTGEVNGARWEEIDLEAKTWTISAERMKAGKEHKVPLSYRAVELLGDVGHADQRLFDIGRDAMKRLIWKMRPGVTVHGFRSSFRDWCGERTNFSREVVEHALAHKLPDKVEAAYRRETALAKRRQLMDAWARYCGMPAAGAAAVPLHG
jgi:integrase